MKRLLLDTHTFLWSISSPDRLGEKTQFILTDGQNDVFVSAVTAWEISIKKHMGKLDAPDNINEVVNHMQFSQLPILIEHGELAGKLPGHHKDPFDRMLIAQAITEGLILVTIDKKIQSYKVTTFNAAS